ncbi:elongation factor 1-gamma-like isoform X2 [Gigantopelta aegis]|uniref:elongation factor 1-gamma-like isoform X2 n=1 Tax=Gigantopelta aegis TaxID=1735272 RepID=UPI001B88A2BA|nr:elongation factor 1-gamma-like isoform X2 [Gigantopelta aegis]
MAAGTLYTYPGNFRAYKALVAAQYSGVDVKVASDFKFGETNKNTNFISKFPLGKVPAFESGDGFCLSESNAIAQYVGNSQLAGKSPKDAAKIQQWISFGDNEIVPSACTWVFPCLGIIQYNKQEAEKAKEQIKKVLTLLNDYLLTRTYLVGERITQADISVSCCLMLLYQHVLDAEFRKPFQNVNRWFTTLVNQKQFKAVVGNFQMCTKMAQFDSKKYAELHGQKKETAKKDSKKEAKPKQAKKEAKPKDEEEAEDDMPKEKESKDPFAAYPKGTFNLDEFKRTYSNKDTVTVALPYFWEKFDKENWSIWYCEYAEDVSKKRQFMCCNLVSGLMQRLDKLRKNAFGCMCLFGEDFKVSISGVWFWRGHDLAFTLSPDWQVDYESYKWKKLDPDDPETKKLVHKYFVMEGDFEGKPFFEGKVYK